MSDEEGKPTHKRHGPNGNRLKLGGKGQPARIMNDELFHQLVGMIRAGNYAVVACTAVGIHEQLYYRYMAYGRDMEAAIMEERDDWAEIFELIDAGSEFAASSKLGGNDYYSIQDCRMIRFKRAVRQGSAMAEATAVLEIRKAMPTQWQAAMTFLERRFPQRWRRRVEITDGDSWDDTGIDETLLLEDPAAVKLIHEALAKVAQLPAGEAVVDATVVEEVTVKRTNKQPPIEPPIFP